MKIMHLISGGDSGGAKTHVFTLVDKLKQNCEVVVGCLMQGVFYKEILEKDVETILFEQKNRFDLRVVADIRRFINERGIEILHIHGARANFIGMFLKKKIGIPVVTTMHSDYLLDFDTFFKKLFFTNLNSLSLKKLDYFISVSDSFKDMLVSRGFKPQRIYPVYNGMDYNTDLSSVTTKEEFAKKYNLELSDDLTYVGIAARFDVVKGVDTFIKGASLAYRKNPNLRFVIAGTGAEEDNLRKLCDELGMNDVIHFLGFVTDMNGFLNFIDLNSLTSHCESFPYSMLEGAGLRCPIIASRVGGIPELVKDGETGILFESKNEADFAEKLLSVVSDKAALKTMGDNIYRVATSRFSADVLCDDHIRIYKTIIDDYKKEKRYDFVLSGYYGFNNSGDDALLLSLITDLKRNMPSARIAVLSSNPLQTMKVFGVDAFGRISPFSLTKLFGSSTALLSGGGSLIQDETSSKSLWYYLFIIAFAKHRGMKVMQIASGIGPVNKNSNRRLTAKVLNSCVDRITLREQKSLGVLRDIGVTIEAEVTADPAISLVGEDEQHTKMIFAKNDIPFGDYICVALRKWKNAAPDFEENMARVLDYASEKYGKQIVFLPMQYPSDVKISQSITDKMNTKAYVVSTPLSIRESVGVISFSDLVVAMRLHSLVYAVSNGVGAIAIRYDPKIDGFMEYFQQKYIADVANITYGELANLIDAYYADNASDTIGKLCIEMKEKAKRNAEIAVSLLRDEQ